MYARELINSLTDYDKFMFYLQNKKQYFRINTIKISEKEFLSITNIKLKKTPIPLAYETEEKVGKTLEYSLGYIHPQSLTSILVPYILNPAPHKTVLDIASAPGSKTTQMAAMMKNSGMIIANEKNRDRISALVGNIERLGVLNTLITEKDGRYIKTKPVDYALVDAPCSSLGSSLDAHKKFTKKRERDMARIQRKLLLNAYKNLKEGGTLVYSTCTPTIKENEEVVSYLLQHTDAQLESIKLPFPIRYEKGLKEYGMEKTIRIYPFHLNSESFFIAKIKKPH